LSSSEPASPKWKLLRAERLEAWALTLTKPQGDLFDARELRERIATLEYVRDVICADPDFGDMIDDHTRSATVPGTTVDVIWTFDPNEHTVEIITPFLEE
jgi:hypothetical protein